MEVTCKSCARVYLWEGYHRGYTKSTCNSCQANKHRLARKRKIVAYLGGACHRCGYAESIVALECHHIDPRTKVYAISGSHCRSWESVQLELDKCTLLCSNCHKIQEYGIIPIHAPVV